MNGRARHLRFMKWLAFLVVFVFSTLVVESQFKEGRTEEVAKLLSTVCLSCHCFLQGTALSDSLIIAVFRAFLAGITALMYLPTPI